MSFANLGRCSDMDAHGLCCICRIAPTIFEETDTAAEYSTDILPARASVELFCGLVSTLSPTLLR